MLWPYRVVYEDAARKATKIKLGILELKKKKDNLGMRQAEIEGQLASRENPVLPDN